MGPGGIKQIILEDAGVPGESGSVYSALETTTTPSGVSDAIITDVGFLWIKPTAANTTLQFQETEDSWSTILTAGGSTWSLVFSDGANFRVHATDSSTTRTLSYYRLN